MSYKRNYAGLIWTNHAFERLTQRGLTQEIASSAFKNPDTTYSGKQPGSTVYEKKSQTTKITLVLKQNDQREFVVLSAWIDPPLPGSVDEKKKNAWKKYQKAGFWGKMWISLKKQLGLGY